MTSNNRAAQFAKVHKVLKKYYKASSANGGRSVMEHLLFACCLEGASHDAAEEAFASLVHTFFDWNEVRVTSISELSEVMASLPDPRAAANRVKRLLHSVFEAMFNFDLEPLRKKNLGPTVQWLEKLDGASKFTVSYVVQSALGGHAIPIDAGTVAALRIMDLVSDEDVTAMTVSGLERAIAKSKGVEFGSLLHEFGAAFSANPYSPTIREILLQIEPSCESRIPKRRVERAVKKAAEPRAAGKSEKGEKAAKSEKAGAKPEKAEKPAKAAAKPEAVEKPGAKKKAAESPVARHVQEPVKKKATEQPKKGGSAEKEKLADRKGLKKRSSSEKLSKRKPR